MIEPFLDDDFIKGVIHFNATLHVFEGSSNTYFRRNRAMWEGSMAKYDEEGISIQICDSVYIEFPYPSNVKAFLSIMNKTDRENGVHEQIITAKKINEFQL